MRRGGESVNGTIEVKSLAFRGDSMMKKLSNNLIL